MPSNRTPRASMAYSTVFMLLLFQCGAREGHVRLWHILRCLCCCCCFSAEQQNAAYVYGIFYGVYVVVVVVSVRSKRRPRASLAYSTVFMLLLLLFQC